MASKVLSDQGTADDLNSNALEIKIASGKVCLVSASKTATRETDRQTDRDRDRERERERSQTSNRTLGDIN